MLDQYSTKINEQFENGITEEVDNSLPTVGIILPRLRTVYDASSKIKGPAMNGCLQVANSRFTGLLGALRRFRSRVLVIIVADIEKAFRIIGIHNNDGNALRFWAKSLLAHCCQWN